MLKTIEEVRAKAKPLIYFRLEYANKLMVYPYGGALIHAVWDFHTGFTNKHFKLSPRLFFSGRFRRGVLKD